MLRLILRYQGAILQHQQARNCRQVSSVSQLKGNVKSFKSRSTLALPFHARASEQSKTGYRVSNSSVLCYHKSVALAIGAGTTLGLLADREPTAFCASKKNNDEDPLGKAKEKLNELSAFAIATLSALLPEDFKNLEKRLDEFSKSGKGGQISGGLCLGACAGLALKKVSKLGAIAIGVLFILLQSASYAGYLNVDYKKLERDCKKFLDINQDGVFDTKDLDSMYNSVMKVLQFNRPAGSGFAVGFLLGFRLG